MTTAIIITISILLLLAYVFDITSSRTKIPSVILLLILGYIVKNLSIFFNVNIPDLNPILPILGTIGLILIVLEGALELELDSTRLSTIKKSSLIALLSLLGISFVLAYLFYFFGHFSYKDSLANAIPLAIISSAIAIPSAKNLVNKDKEFVTYESSLSDIFGVIFFNFITLNDNIGATSFGFFLFELLVILIISFVATLSLAYFLNKIKHSIKFAPIIIMILLIYSVSKEYHLPGLIFILLFGLFLGNIDKLRKFAFIQQFDPINFSKEVHKFRELTTEFAFLVRALFFLVFGFLIQSSELLNQDTILWAVAIVSLILIFRAILLKIFRFSISPLLYVAPRGLITILLFLSIPYSQQITIVDKSLILQVIILSALVMMFGLMSYKKK